MTTKCLFNSTRWLVTILLLSLCIGNASGGITNNNNGTYTETSGTATNSSSVNTWSFAGGNITVAQSATGGNTPSSSYRTDARIYRYNTLTVSASNGFKVEKVEIVCDGSYYGNSIAAGTSVSNNTVGNTANVTSDVSYSDNHTHSFIPNTAGAKTLFYIRNVNSGSTNTQIRWASGGLKVTYSYTAPTEVAKGTVTSSDFGLTITDALNTNSYEIYFNTGSSAPADNLASGFQTVATKTPTISSGVSAGKTYYVWVRSKKAISSDIWKSSWVALTGNTLSTPAAAACAADVAIGTASLNGSFNLSSVGVQCASITVGSNCAVASNNYGFIWYQGTGNKEIGGSGVTRVNNSGAYSSGAFSNTLSSTFVAGTTYTFRAFAINDKPSTAYSAAVSFTPYTVTFNMNGHGSAIAQQVVNTGGTASTPSAPSATGYTFGGWYQEAGCTNSWNFSTTITSGNTTDGNRNLYAKWTAKEYTVTLDNESPTVSGSTSVTLTYNSALHAAISNPTKTGYTFAGWWTADNGTGTEVINTSGVLQANVSNYTGAGGIWTRDNNSTTLYAKWTAKSFDVTWMVNGETYSAGGSTSVDFNSHVATLPTAPTPPCGNKFMGWTTTNIGSVGIDKANTSAITALNLFTTAGSAPTISAEGNVTYYAVFADYAE